MKKYSGLIFALLLPVFFQGLKAQGNRSMNQPKYDSKVLHFGFCLGLNYSDFYIERSADFGSIEGLYGIRTETMPGYNIGIVSDLRLHENLALRFIPSFATTQRNIYFDAIDPISNEREEVKREVESSYIEFPFTLKYRGDRIANYRWYVLGGVKYNLDLASQEDVLDDQIFKIVSNDVLYEMGIGIDIYFDYFKFSPQIKASFGVNNLLVEDGTLFVEGIESLRTRSILINLTFE